MSHDDIHRAVCEAIAHAIEMGVENTEQKAIALLHERGIMASLTCDQQRNVEGAVRDMLLEIA